MRRPRPLTAKQLDTLCCEVPVYRVPCTYNKMVIETSACSCDVCCRRGLWLLPSVAGSLRTPRGQSVQHTASLL
jgi:hypothetical protein